MQQIPQADSVARRKRMISSIATQYHRRGFSVFDDTLTANGTRIKPLLEHGMDFILVVKPGSNAALFYALDQYMRLGQQQALETVDGLVTWLPIDRTRALNEGYTKLLVDSLEYNVNWKLPGAILAVDEQLVDYPPAEKAVQIKRVGRAR